MSALPAPLARWEESLTGLDPALALALGPLLHVIDELVGRLDDDGGDAGELEGYDGLTRRGDPGRLLMSEWLLADELPLEFLRRAVDNELAYLRPAYRAPTRGGTVVAVCDAGPEQWGAGRLVQLAALVVLDRRARAVGAELEVAILQGASRLTGPLEKVLPMWLRARSPRSASAAEVTDALAQASGGDRVWLLSGPGARAHVPRHRRALSSWPVSWDADGVDRTALRIGDTTTAVTVPASALAVAALRGDGIARRGRTGLAAVGTVGQGAVFGSADSRLLWRGDSDRVVHTCFVSDGHPRVRRHQLPGAVLAAASLGRRVVTAGTDGERLRINVIGKDLARTGRIDVALGEVDLTADDVAEIVQAPLRPLYLRGGRMLVPLGERWWFLDAEGAVPADVSAAAPGPALDTPRVAELENDRFLVVGGARLPRASAAAAILFGPQEQGVSWSATTADTRVWTVWKGEEPAVEIGVPAGEEAIGLSLLAGVPTLLVVTASRRLLRAISAGHTKTWTRWSGPAHFDLHPTRPWVVRTKEDGILVGDLQSGLILLDLQVHR